jgi:prepilin-type N-terminal cleavage/methylation domain-containing protein
MPTLSVGDSRGVTLVELLIVLAIVGLIAGISFPTLSAGLDGVRLTSATDAIATFLNGAVNRAERRQQVVALVITPKDRVLAMYSGEPGFARRIELPEGITIRAVLPPAGEDPGAPRRFLLLPGGSPPRVGVEVADRRGRARVVSLDPITGFPRVENVEPK